MAKSKTSKKAAKKATAKKGAAPRAKKTAEEGKLPRPDGFDTRVE